MGNCISQGNKIVPNVVVEPKPDKPRKQFVPVEQTPKLRPITDYDISAFRRKHSWYKHLGLERNTIFYPWPCINSSFRNQYAREGIFLWDFISNVNFEGIDPDIWEICSRYSFGASCFLSSWSNTGLSIDCAKENKEWALETIDLINRVKSGKSLPKNLTPYEINRIHEFVVQNTLPHVPLDIYDFCERDYPDVAKLYKTNPTNYFCLSPMIKREQDIQIGHIRDSAESVYKEIISRNLEIRVLQTKQENVRRWSEFIMNNVFGPLSTKDMEEISKLIFAYLC